MKKGLGYFPLFLGVLLFIAGISTQFGHEVTGIKLRSLILMGVGGLFAWCGYWVVTGGEGSRQNARALQRELREAPHEAVASACRDLAAASPAELGRLLELAAQSRFAPLLLETGLICEACGREASTRRADYTEVKGRLLWTEVRTFRGSLCGACSRRYFAEFTTATATQGWLGFKSFLLTLIALPVNVVSRALARALDPQSSPPPKLDHPLLKRLAPAGPAMAARLAGGMRLRALADSTSGPAKATAGQIALYLLTLAAVVELKATPPIEGTS